MGEKAHHVEQPHPSPSLCQEVPPNFEGAEPRGGSEEGGASARTDTFILNLKVQGSIFQ